MAENIHWEVEQGIGTLTIQRPKALNALNAETMMEIEAVVDQVATDDSVRVVIITGDGEKAFVAGADIAYMANMTAIEGRKWGMIGQRVFQKIEDLPQPVIAAVNGFALGGGCELAMACDIRYASDNAKFGQPEVSLGILPGFGGTQRLPRLIGKGRAKELLYTGNMISADEAYRIGLVNKVIPQSNLLDTIRFATDTPFQTIDSIVASHLPADFDPNERNGGTTYPEIIALTLHGFYGDIVPAERSISYVIAKDPDTAQFTGFALQHFHDADSYMFAKPDEDPRWSVYVQPTELLRTVAANLDAYRSFISDTIATTSATDSDTKRVAELRQLDTNDLVLFDTALHEHIVPDPTLSTE